jgi:quercetin 2,3-dioxygenase
VHLVHGGLTVNDKRLAAGDALKLTGLSHVELSGGNDAEVLVFDLPGRQ